MIDDEDDIVYVDFDNIFGGTDLMDFFPCKFLSHSFPKSVKYDINFLTATPRATNGTPSMASSVARDNDSSASVDR